MTPDTPADVVAPALVRGLAEELESPADDAPKALEQAWSGLRTARLLGLRLSTVDLMWRRRQGNAEAVEFQLARDLGTSATFARVDLALPMPASVVPLPADEADAALVALIRFSAAARRHMLAAAPLAEHWHDERVLRHDSKVFGSLGEAWLGRRAGFHR
ncbi:hypothetical protein GCM10022243_36460 [Saccharothrix violaceirubra]|uniref:Uncharacterized protein n=1 Tax=Saccharothrix violaceirubra TaxID=413306 RepID=A0A7W7SZV5_9PSEU|nr:hypothetical protein [Saccharothrix violaceirubra]MBB4964018.1 hypothetical protein [Saccharothrix violaceirubra]